MVGTHKEKTENVEVTVTYFQVLFWTLSGRTERNTEKSQYSHC
jgi:hypothetical protein